ncbi:MAG: hypothetical protein RR551_08020 [Mucinivorans sp.]
MKKLLIICFAALATAAIFTSCKENKGKVLDPLAKISIKPSSTPASVASKATYLSPVEVVKLTTDIAMKSKLAPKEPYINYGISDEQRDLTTPKLMMWGMWVIDKGALTPDFIEAAYDVVFVAREGGVMNKPIKDTLAYIPNATLRAAEKSIKTAFDRGDYNEVYKLFDEAYKFIPIDGAGWRALKEK